MQQPALLGPQQLARDRQFELVAADPLVDLEVVSVCWDLASVVQAVQAVEAELEPVLEMDWEMVVAAE